MEIGLRCLSLFLSSLRVSFLTLFNLFSFQPLILLFFDNLTTILSDFHLMHHPINMSNLYSYIITYINDI